MGAKRRKAGRLLHGARVYLSGPMDFVASRANERRFGWRNRVGEFLRKLGVVVFDPWDKPKVRGFHEYGREGDDTTDARKLWSFEDSPDGARARAKCSGQFWQTLHIDLRMVDTSDFTIAYCPTNIYSVGTPHEIVTARLQRKPVLFVSPQVTFPALTHLRDHLAGDERGRKLLEALEQEVPIKLNPQGVPSLWYMPLVGPESFFDGFGFRYYRQRFGWRRIPLDDRDDAVDLKRPLLPFLERLNTELPPKWDNRRKRYVPNDDWLLWELTGRDGGKVKGTYGAE
jgi:hypothetical protein